MGKQILEGFISKAPVASFDAFRKVRSLAVEESGQGTTEYAILVGVLVVTNASQ